MTVLLRENKQTFDRFIEKNRLQRVHYHVSDVWYFNCNNIVIFEPPMSLKSVCCKSYIYLHMYYLLP